MNPKDFSFGLLSLMSLVMCGILACLNWMVTSLWLQGYGDVYSWAGVAAMSILGLILLWRAANGAYRKRYQLPQRKEKEKIKPSESYEEDEESYLEDEQRRQKSNP
jgi:accessory gene regulator protein AgrB